MVTGILFSGGGCLPDPLNTPNWARLGGGATWWNLLENVRHGPIYHEWPLQDFSVVVVGSVCESPLTNPPPELDYVVEQPDEYYWKWWWRPARQLVWESVCPKICKNNDLQLLFCLNFICDMIFASTHGTFWTIKWYFIINCCRFWKLFFFNLPTSSILACIEYTGVYGLAWTSWSIFLTITAISSWSLVQIITSQALVYMFPSCAPYRIAGKF